MREPPTFEAPRPRLCDDCGAEGAGPLPGTIASSKQLCPSCGENYVREQREREQAIRAEHYRRKADQKLDDLANRYPRMRDWTLETYPAAGVGAEALRLAKRWTWGFDPDDDNHEHDYPLNLLLHGPVGSGKSGLAWASLQWLIEHDSWSADFVNVRDLLADCRAYFNGNRDADPLEGLDAVRYLVIDDLGAERPTEFALDAIATLVERRYQAERRTIVTSNYAPSKLVKRLKPPHATDDVIGQRIVSRLVESCATVEINRADLRLKRAA